MARQILFPLCYIKGDRGTSANVPVARRASAVAVGGVVLDVVARIGIVRASVVLLVLCTVLCVGSVLAVSVQSCPAWWAKRWNGHSNVDIIIIINISINSSTDVQVGRSVAARTSLKTLWFYIVPPFCVAVRNNVDAMSSVLCDAVRWRLCADGGLGYVGRSFNRVQ